MEATNQPERSRMQISPYSEAGEAGYILLAVVVMVALVLLSLAVAAPILARGLQRDKEVESEHRAQQYVRAIRLYQRKFPGQYPPSIEALEKSNNIRFLRQQYVDPLTGKSEWRLIHLGQQKTTIKIPFGEELAGIAATGLGSAAGMASPGIGATPTGVGGTASTIGATSALASGFSGASIGSNSPTGAGTGLGAGATGASGSSGVTSVSASSFGTSATSGKLGGGGPIVGVGTQRSGNSILNPNQQSTYETWEFWYDPRIEQLYRRANILGGGGGALSTTGGSGGINSTSASSFGQDAVSGKSNAPSSSSSAGATTTNTPH